jgi:hypothetical protein
MYFFLATVGLADFFLHSISRFFYYQSFAPIGSQKTNAALRLVGQKNISASTIVIF